MRIFAIALTACLSLHAQEVSQSGLRLQAERPMMNQPERARHGMVTSVHELASQAGIEIMQKGGNAVDAAVAVGIALAVVHPEAGNLGGGGYMLIRMADGRSLAVDYKEVAPGASKIGMFGKREEADIGYKASAVPGTPAGLAMAHEKFGKLPWKDVVEPARRLAADGFPASQRMEIILKLQVPVMKQFPETAKVFLKGSDQPLLQGELVKQPDLARTLERMQKLGAREFYEGETARLIAADMKANGGAITYEDLKNYRAIARTPLESTYRGHPVLAMPPSSGGGITLMMMLNILEQFTIPVGAEGSSLSRHLQAEAMRRAFRERGLHLADPAFVPVDIGKLLSKDFAKSLASNIRLDRATPSAEIGKGESSGGNESQETTHFSVIDKDGNIVSNTYTLNGFFGSQVIAKGTGVLLNDIMSAFSHDPKSKNVIAPGKRPLSSMNPTIVCRKDGVPWFALGSPGSQTIPNSILNVIQNIIDFKMSLRDAVEYPRIHQQFEPDRIDAEPAALVLDVAEKLKAMGHKLNPRFRSQGDVHAVMVEDGTGMRLGWSDGRRGGKAFGY
ncbi:MAG: gamma-glutamyltransferase [Bryobacteraceae bacterium]|nr:gamma-glutamyltransferase [Bryobacteraceae bacterium]